MAPDTVRPSVTYHAPHAAKPPVVHGRLDEELWARAPRTTRFGDAVGGGVAYLATEAALAWDERHLYVAGWLEDRDVWSTGEARSGLVWPDNTFELFVASDGALYQLSVNPAGRTEQLLFVWQDAWVRGGRYDTPDLDLATRAPMVVGGDSGPHHRRGRRWLFDEWQLPGLRAATRVDGSLDERLDIDRGWTVELALPWTGLAHLLDGAAPPAAGTRLRVALARNEVIDQMRSRQTAVWSWHAAGAAGLYAPESYPVVELAPA